MNRIVRLAPVVLLSLFVGCSDTTGPDSFRLNRLRWEKQNLHNYAYTGHVACFCPLPHEDVFVTVLSDVVSSVRLVSTGVEVPKEGWQTVDQLFDFVERTFADKTWSITVEYDPALGYPTLIDAGCPAADCAVGIRVRNLGGLVTIN